MTKRPIKAIQITHEMIWYCCFKHIHNAEIMSVLHFNFANLFDEWNKFCTGGNYERFSIGVEKFTALLDELMTFQIERFSFLYYIRGIYWQASSSCNCVAKLSPSMRRPSIRVNVQQRKWWLHFEAWVC